MSDDEQARLIWFYSVQQDIAQRTNLAHYWKIKTVVVFGILILVSSCASRFPAVDDSALIQSWSRDLQRQEPYRYPFIATYKKEDKKLVFVASTHENQVDSLSFKTIRKVVEDEKFDLFVVEGIPRSLSVSPPQIIEQAMTAEKNGFFRGGESNYTIVQAQKLSVSFIGVEPDETDIILEMEKNGYSREDLLFFYLVRQIPQWRRENELNNEPLPAMSERFLKWYVSRLSLSRARTYAEFETWYTRKVGKPFSVNEIDTETSAPYENGSIFTQRISAAISKARNAFMLKAVKAEMKRYPRVMIVYGGSHWVVQSKAWEAFLGKPRFQKPFND